MKKLIMFGAIILIMISKQAIVNTNNIQNETKVSHFNFPLYTPVKILPTPEVTSKPNYTEEDLYWLAKIVYAETGEDTNEGQQAVANVVINRVNSSEFPTNIYDVVWQKTGKTYQFSPCADGGIKRDPDERSIENAKIILEGKRVLPEDILYFYMPTKGNKKNWIRSREVYAKIGVHRFCY